MGHATQVGSVGPSDGGVTFFIGGGATGGLLPRPRRKTRAILSGVATNGAR